MHIRFVTITKCDNHKMYFSQSAQFQHYFFVQVVKHTKCIYHDNSPKKRKKTEKFRLFLKKLLTTCKLTIKISLRNKKRQPHIYSTVGAVGYIPEYVTNTNILGFQLPFFLYYDYGLNAFNCQAICYFYRSIFGLAFFILQVNII